MHFEFGFYTRTSLSGCVQPTHIKTVVSILNVSEMKAIKTVGIRGEKPLRWRFARVQ